MCNINCSGGREECSPEDHKKTPHKHAVLIKAWADGEEIEYKRPNSPIWKAVNMGNSWLETNEFRIKPEPKPDVVKYGCVWWDKGTEYGESSLLADNIGCDSNVKYTFDGETGELKSVVMFQYTGNC